MKKHTEKPTYTKKIYEQVRELIEADTRDKKPGEAIDTEVGYARRFGVSRPTARKAVEDLIHIGLIKRIAGKGLVMAIPDEIPYRGKLLIALPHQIGDGFLFKVTMGCIEQANRLGFGYKILGVLSPKVRFEQVSRERLEDYAAVITCCYDSPYEHDLVNMICSRGVPLMLIDNPSPDGVAPCITCNDYNGGYMMGQYLARKGHRNIVNLSVDRKVLTIQRRDAGFLQALSDAGVDYDTSLLISEPYSEANTYTTLFEKRFIAEDFKSGRVTAICSHTSLAIMEVSPWLYANNLHVGEDVSIMGYGDHPYLSILNIPFTNISVPGVQMGHAAVDEIDDALMNRRPLQNVELEVRLEKRMTVKRLVAEA